MKELNNIQKAAYELIQADARFLYTLCVIQQNAKNISSNYMMMSQPYIGVFADGSEQWCRKIRMSAPKFTEEEKKYYSVLRESHKLFELPCREYLSILKKKLQESDAYFYSIRSPLERIIGYYNVGTDLYEGEFCGNTILGALYLPVEVLNNNGIGLWIRDISVVAGKLAAFFECTNFKPYRYDVNASVRYKDYHFYKNCPIGNRTDLGFLLFSVLCSVNYAIKFINGFFLDEIPQKFKFAYLQYFYLCSFIPKINVEHGTQLFINDSLKDRKFRNCLAHYGLGQYLSESDLCLNDPLKGLTQKAFNMDYNVAKEKLYLYLRELVNQVKTIIDLKTN